MTFVPQSRVLPRSLWRPAMLLFAAAQMLLAFAPLAESGSTRAHVEQAGTSLHHAHNEADCTACIARVLLADAHPALRGEIPAPAHTSNLLPTASAAAESAWSAHTRSRAPPSIA